MSRRELCVLLVALTVGAAACGGPEGEEGTGDRDTLAIEAPEEDPFEEGARKIGGHVGEVLGRTGEAIEDAGERMQEETGEPAPGDTNRM